MGYLIFAILLVVAGFVIIRQAIVVRQLVEALDNAATDYKALDRGMDEQREAYEQDFLSMNEYIEAMDGAVEIAAEELEHLRKSVETLNADNYELTRAKEDLMVIVSDLQEQIVKHNENCLIDLEAMRAAALRQASLRE